MPVYLEVLSGPWDGYSKLWPEGEVEVRLGGDLKTSFLAFEYDPDFPTEGVCLRLQEDGIQIEVGGNSVLRRYGELFKVGQIWLRVRKEE